VFTVDIKFNQTGQRMISNTKEEKHRRTISFEYLNRHIKSGKTFGVHPRKNKNSEIDAFLEFAGQEQFSNHFPKHVQQLRMAFKK